MENQIATNEAVLATYLTGSAASLPRAVLVSLVLSFTHVAISVVIALLALLVLAPPAPAPAFAWTSLRVAQKAASNATSPDTPSW